MSRTTDTPERLIAAFSEARGLLQNFKPLPPSVMWRAIVLWLLISVIGTSGVALFVIVMIGEAIGIPARYFDLYAICTLAVILPPLLYLVCWALPRRYVRWRMRPSINIVVNCIEQHAATQAHFDEAVAHASSTSTEWMMWGIRGWLRKRCRLG